MHACAQLYVCMWMHLFKCEQKFTSAYLRGTVQRVLGSLSGPTSTTTAETCCDKTTQCLLGMWMSDMMLRAALPVELKPNKAIALLSGTHIQGELPAGSVTDYGIVSSLFGAEYDTAAQKYVPVCKSWWLTSKTFCLQPLVSIRQW